MRCCTVLGSFTYVWTVARFAWLRNSPHCCTIPHCKYFISSIIYQLWKIKSTYNGCNLRERKSSLWCAACWQWCICCADSKCTNCHLHQKRNGDWCVGHWHVWQNNGGGDIDSNFIQECGFLVVSYQKRILPSAAFLEHAQVQDKKKKKSVIHIISAICRLKRNSVRTFSLSWEMTQVCWNHLVTHKWTCRNKRKGIKEQTVCSRSSVCLDLYKAFDGTSKVSVEM